MTPPALEELARKVEQLAGRLRNVILHPDLSASGQATAIAMIVTMNLGTLDEAAEALRARATLAREVGDHE